MYTIDGKYKKYFIENFEDQKCILPKPINFIIPKNYFEELSTECNITPEEVVKGIGIVRERFCKA